MPNTAADGGAVVNPGHIDEEHLHVAAAIVWESSTQQRFLIARRPKGKHLEDLWELPGGKLEAGESPADALRRELEEEIGIDAVQVAPFMRVYYRYPERNVLLDTWVVESFRGEISAREQQELCWVGIETVDTFNFPPADLPILEAIKYSWKAETRRRP